MIYLQPNQSNTIVVTWSQRATSSAASYYLLNVRKIESNVETLVVVPKVSNLSAYARYDRFTIATQFSEGSYEYTAYEATGVTLDTAIAVVESGLMEVDMSESVWLNDGSTKVYSVYENTDVTVNPAPAPLILTAAGTYAGFVEVQVSGTVSGNIYYTTDGSTPSSQNGTLYNDAARPVLTSTALFQARLYADGFTLGAVAAAYYVINPVTLSATPAGGTYLLGALGSVVLETDNEAADIYYTTDGTEPTTSSILYTGAITAFDRITTLKARAFAPPALPSAIVTEQYDMKANAPTLDTVSGTYISSRTVVATNPNPSGTLEYNIGAGWVASGSVNVTESATVRFRVVASGLYVTSEEASVAVTIQCAAPTISPNGGTAEGSQEVTLVTNEAGGTTYYTTDGSTPTSGSTEYTAPFTLLQSATVKAITYRAGTEPSDVTQAAFVILQKYALVGDAGSTNRRLYRSLNDGSSWTEIQPFGNTTKVYIDSQISEDGGSVVVLAGLPDEIRISKDSMQTWQTPSFPSTPTFIPSVRGSSDGSKYIACARVSGVINNIFISTDGGLTFVDRSPSAATFISCEISPDGGVMYAFKSSISSGDNDVIYRSTDNGLNWSVVLNEANRRVTFASCSDAAVYVNIVNQNDGAIAIGRITHDSTLLVNLTTAIGSLGAVSAIQRGISVSNNDDLIIAWSTAGATTRYSTNQGTSFSTATLTFSSARRMNINSIGTKVIVGGTNNDLNISTDGGATYATPAATPGSGTRTWQLADLN